MGYVFGSAMNSGSGERNFINQYCQERNSDYGEKIYINDKVEIKCFNYSKEPENPIVTESTNDLASNPENSFAIFAIFIFFIIIFGLIIYNIVNNKERW